MPRIIAHLDMDAFFAAIEERDKPRIKGLPIVIGSDPKDGKGRGIVATANYKAREYGIFSATPITKAWKLSEKAKNEGKPPVVFIGGRHRHYSEVSSEIMKIIRTYAPEVEVASIDEAYLDLSFAGSYKKAIELAKKLKKEIKNKEELSASIGVGPNKLIAKIASDMQKPDGLTVIGDDNEGVCAELVEAFLEPLLIRKIPGLGPKAEIKFHKLGVKTIKDLKNLYERRIGVPREAEGFLRGKWGTALYKKARGESDSLVEEGREAKSIGEQETFPEDSLDPTFVAERMNLRVKDVIQRFEESEFKTYGSVTITVRFQGFITKTRSRTLEKPASDQKTLEFEALKLIYPFFDKRENPQHKKIRLVGVRIEKLKKGKPINKVVK